MVEFLPLREQRSPGEITTINKVGVTVALSDGALKIGKIKGEGGGKMDADEFAKSTGLKVGMRFGY